MLPSPCLIPLNQGITLYIVRDISNWVLLIMFPLVLIHFHFLVSITLLYSPASAVGTNSPPPSISIPLLPPSLWPPPLPCVLPWGTLPFPRLSSTTTPGTVSAASSSALSSASYRRATPSTQVSSAFKPSASSIDPSSPAFNCPSPLSSESTGPCTPSQPLSASPSLPSRTAASISPK